MLRHRKLTHPVSVDEMNEAVRSRRLQNDATCLWGMLQIGQGHKIINSGYARYYNKLS
ncbi:hypothetical protein QUF80_03055 [Desulfococcaceae bacterium HSG8]|nr:hypothetical protein [Desulfococcaceae bacterium HSG8]